MQQPDGVELRTIPGYDSRYLAGSDGHIYSLMKMGVASRTGPSDVPRRLVESSSSSGLYCNVNVLTDAGRRVSRDVQQLIAPAFHGPRPTPGHVASHQNGNGWDNRPENLAWETQAENLEKKKLHGTHDAGFANSRAAFTPEDVDRIFALRKEGRTQQQIAEEFGVSRTSVLRVLNGERYAYA